MDRTVGVVGSIIISILARIAGFILRRDHSPATNPQAVVVAKFVGLGSIVYSAYLCLGLKKKFPGTKLYFLTTVSCAPLARRLQGIDDVLIVDDKSILRLALSNVKLLWELWQIRPDLYFDLEVYSAYASILSNLSLARNRYGFYRKSVAFKKGLFSHPVFFNTRRHISEIYSEMAKVAGFEAVEISEDSFRVTRKDEKRVESLLAASGWESKEIVLVNPNASELMLERRWPKENWRIFLEEITAKWPTYAFMLTGTNSEKPYVDEIYLSLSERAKGNILHTAGKWDLGSFLALLKRACLLVTVDSGPLHLAGALGVPTISLWGPVEPDHYAPRKGLHIRLYRPPYCSPCLHHADVPPCHGDNICMKQITPALLIEAVDNFFLAREKPK